VPPVYYGGYVIGSPTTGYSSIAVSDFPDLLAVSVGPKVPTSDTVFVVNVKGRTYPTRTKEIFHAVQRIVIEEKQALQSGDNAKLGELMLSNHALLMELGVSSEKLDAMVTLAKEKGAYGAKLSGGGGGGMGVVNCNPARYFLTETAMQDAGFEVERIEVTQTGVKKQIEEAVRM
jgi:mevalonate kinase